MWDGIASRDIEIFSYANIAASEYHGDETLKALEQACKECGKAEKKNGIDDFSVELAFENFVDEDAEPVTKEAMEQNPEKEYYAVLKVDFHGEETANYFLGRISNDWYSPDDPPEIEGFDKDELEGEVIDIFAAACEKCGVKFDKDDIEIDDNATREWDDILADITDYEPDYEPREGDYDY